MLIQPQMLGRSITDTSFHAGHRKALGCLQQQQQQTCTPRSPKWPTLSPSVMQIALMRLSGQFFKIWYTIPAALMCCQRKPSAGEAQAHESLVYFLREKV